MKRTLGILLAFFLLSGCSGEGPRGTVRGKALLDGQPLKEGTVSLENTEKGIALTGQIQPDGSFELSSHKGAGLPVGSYKVAVSPSPMLQSAEEIPLVGKNPKPPKDVSKSPVPAKYLKSATSGLTAEVKEGSNPPLEINLKK
ncbi:MAG: carboxypeptidase regulatory-like domain-containing protein [Gemmataceae bacterium]|nr:carboxypeptidase regulatory-like domain-containing protein [Gemmataceae bacterium]